jgi:putative membrane protein
VRRSTRSARGGDADWRRYAISAAPGLIGLGAFLWLFHATDLGVVLKAVTAIGAGLSVIVLLRIVVVATCGIAWWRLLPRLASTPIRVLIGLRTIGEAINVLMPVAAVGGDVVRAMLLKSRGVTGGAAAASTLVDVLLQAAAQVLFLLIGLALMVLAAAPEGLALCAGGGSCVALLALGGFYAAQRFGGARMLERGLAALSRRWQAAAAWDEIRLDAPLQAIYADPAALAASFVLHELAWLVLALETWLALRMMGAPVGLSTALILESLGQALRSAAFPVPSGLGVQEGGYVAVGAAFGIPPETALALSLVKRVPDLAIGLPTLLAWGLLQLQRLSPINAAPARVRRDGAPEAALLANPRRD